MTIRSGPLFSLFLLFHVIQGQKCRSDRGCNRDLVKCGFCVEGYCQFPFVNIYTPGKSCNFNTNKCKNKSCTVGKIKHSPVEGYSSCVCECSVGRYGQYCEKEGTSGVTYTSGVQLIAPTVVECLEAYSVFVTVQEQGTGVDGSPRNLTVLLTTASGVFGAIATVPTLKKVTTEKAVAFCKRRSWDPDVCRYFRFNDANGMNLVFAIPLRLPFWYPETWTWSNATELSMTGLTQTLRLEIASEGLELNAFQQQLVVSYSNVRKSETPVPALYNCGKHIESPVIFTEGQEIYLKSVMLFASEDKSQDSITLKENMKKQGQIHFEWKAFRVELNSQTLQSDYYYIGESFWRASPFSWRHGLYIVRLEARAIDLVRIDNYGQCYLKVELEPLVAAISGGAERVVNIGEEIVFDPSGSQDPNRPAAESKLTFTMSCNWTAEAVCQHVYRDDFFYDGGLAKPPFRYSPTLYKLEVGKVYEFTLKVESRVTDYSLEPAHAHQLVTVQHFPSNFPLKSFEIECFYNCVDVNPEEMVFLNLKGSWNLLEHFWSDLQWTLFVGDYQLDINLFREHHRYSSYQHIFIVIKQTLEEDATYQFKVHFKNTELLANYKISTSLSTETDCSIEPFEGLRLHTLFKVSCNSTGVIDGYEFYNKEYHDYKEMGTFSGRMIAFQKTGELDNAILDGKYLEVYTLGKNGFRTVVGFEVEFERRNSITAVEIFNRWFEMNEVACASNIDVLHRDSAILKFWIPSENRSALLRMLKWLNMVQPKTGSDAKLWTSTLRSIAVVGYRKTSFDLSLDEALQAAVTLAAISRTLMRESAKHISPQFPFDDYYKVFSYLLDCILIVLESGKNEVHGLQKIYPELRYLAQVETIHKLVIDTLRRIGMILLSRQFPNQDQAMITSVMGWEESMPGTDYLVVAKVEYPSEKMFADMWHYQDTFFLHFLFFDPVIIPEELKSTLIQMGYFVGLQVTLLRNYRAVWWHTEVRTLIIYVQMCYRQDVGNECSYPQWLESPIRVAFYIYDLFGEEDYQDESVTRLNELRARDVLDLEMKVFKIDLPPRACLSVYFKLASKRDELIVLIKKGIKPGYRTVEREGRVITSRNDYYDVKCEANDQPEFYYMVVLAGERTLLHETLHFQYKALYRLCLSWNGMLRQWESEGSLVLTDDEGAKVKLICQWSRLSVFAGDVRTPQVMVDRLQDMVIYFTPWSNRTSGLKCLALFTLLFMLGFIGAWWADRHQNAKRFVIVLADNFPREKNGYLLCVMTGSRIKAGTDANVGVRIYGTDGESRAHVLRSEERDVMGWLGEDWFLLFTHRHLGTLESLHIWLDNSSKSPAWFCNSIQVFDMKMENYYIFSVNEWITLGVTRLPEAIVKPVQSVDLTTPYRTFMDHLMSGFRQHHLWLASVFRHPRDPIRRTDRLMAITCFILVSMSTSLLLVTFSERGLYLESKEDMPNYSVQWVDIVISFISLVVATVVAGLIICMLRMSYKVWYCSEEEDKFKLDHLSCRTPQYLMLNKDDLLFADDPTHLSYRSSDLFSVKDSSITQLFALQFMERPLIPVQLLGDKSAVDVNWGWRCRAVLFCLLMVVKSVVVCVVWSEHFSPNRIKRWLSIVAIATGLHAVVYLPLKIIIISLILTLAFDRIIYKDFYTFDPVDCWKVNLYGDAEHLRKLIRERTKPEYQPIQELAHEVHRLKRMRMMKWRKIFEFLVVLVFITVLSECLSKDSLRKYVSNSHLRSMVTASRDRSSPGYCAIYNMTQFDNYLQEAFSLSVFQLMWYNLKELQGDETKSDRKDWCFDNTHRMLGLPHFRQFRVKPGYCRVPRIMEDIGGRTLDCAAAWGSGRAEDTRVYKPYWIPPENLNNSYWSLQFNHSSWSQQFIANWSYVVNWAYTNETDYTYYGRSGYSYPAGGYNRSLWGKIRVELNIQDEGWVEHHTRAVLTQVALYNVNTRYLTQVTLVAEQTVAGEFITTVTVQPVDVIFEMDTWMVLLAGFTILHFVRISMMMNNLGLVGYFKKGHRIFELLLLVLLLSSIADLIQHYFVAVNYDEIGVKEDSQSQFYKKSNHFSSARSMFFVIFVLAVVYIYYSHLWRFGQHFLNFFHTLILSFKSVIWLVIILILFLSIFCSLIYLISTFVAVVLNPNLIWKFSFLTISKKQQSLRFKILCFTHCFGSLITAMLMLVNFIYEYKKAKKYIVNERYSVHLVQFLIQEIGIFFKLKDATELKENYEISIRPKTSATASEENISMSDDNKEDDLEPEIPTERRFDISSLRPTRLLSNYF